MFIYHFVGLDRAAEIFFEKKEATEIGSASSEIGNWETSANLYWSRREFLAEPVCFFIGLL